MMLIFETTTGSQIMLPVERCSFEQHHNESGTYVVAKYDREIYLLKTTLMEIQRLMGPRKIPFVDCETKNIYPVFKGSSGA